MRLRATLAYGLGAVSGGVAIAIAAWAVGQLPPRPAVFVGGGVVASYALLWHLLRQPSFVGNRDGRQADKERARSPLTGRFYFGTALGIGIITYMTTPLVYGLLFIDAAVPIGVACLVGAAFGMGRSVPAFAGYATRMSPGEIGAFFGRRAWLDTLVGCIVSLVVLGIVVVQLP